MRPILQDEVVVLRDWHASDLDFIFESRQDPAAQRFLAGMPSPFTRADAERYLAYDQQQPLRFAIADASSGEPLGSVWVDHDRGIAEIGYWLAPAARGCGQATRAVRLLVDWLFSKGEATVEICTHPDNRPAQAVAERAGFERAGVVESYVTWPDGTTRAARLVRTH